MPFQYLDRQALGGIEQGRSIGSVLAFVETMRTLSFTYCG